jgi:hypothetical protein
MCDIPNDFNWKTYLLLNPDLNQDSNEEELKNHYLNHGINENRKYKIKIPNHFNWKKYLQLNPDLSKYCTEKEAIDHYLNSGFFQNRIYEDNDCKLNIINYTNNEIFSSISYNDVNESKIFRIIYDYSLLSKEYILIIDFPNLKGGTEYFLNTIISKYKKNKTFVIVRNINDQVQITINDDFLLGKYDEIHVIDFINRTKNNINKIFLNHILGHSNYFIDFILNLNIEITTISHDYFLINENAQAYYDDIKYTDTRIDFKKIKNLILQNEENLNIFKHFLSENHNVMICPLPDFKYSLELYNTNNNEIVIGILGFISKEKGQEILNNIISHIKNNNLNIKVIIFGHTNIDYEHQYKYNNIDELNNLLKIHKPNLLFETSIWPETYSYTLTLSMLTQLPILSFKKNFKNVIENRLNSYDKKYFYENIEDFFNLVNVLKQNYFYTIDQTIYFNSFWDNFFTSNSNIDFSNNSIDFSNNSIDFSNNSIDFSNNSIEYINQNNKNINLPSDFDWIVYKNINTDLSHLNQNEVIKHYIEYGYAENRIYKFIDLKNKNIVFITSKIYTSDNKFSYVDIRSVYTPEERFIQTLETIVSIRNKIPNPYIILFDNSIFINNDYFNVLKINVDKFINITTDENLNYHTDKYKYKAFSDISQQLSMYNTFLKFVDIKTIKNFFKLSGRYIINDSFNFNNYDNNDIIFKKNNNVIDRDYYYTCFYKLTPNIIHEYFYKLKILFDKKHLYENNISDLEVILPKTIIDKITLIEKLGITQKIAVFKEIEDI